MTMKGQKAAWGKRVGIYITGIFILALGISFSVKSNLGVSPVTSVPFVLSRIFGLTLGTMTVYYYIFCMALQAVILWRAYRIINLLQILVSLAFGVFTDLTSFMISFLPVTDNIIIRFIYLALGISCVAFGVMLYLNTALIALPTDGTVQAISFKGKFKLHRVKIAYDCVSTVLALVLSFSLLRGIDGIGVGTFIAAVGVGRMLGLFSKLLKARLLRFLGMPGGAAVPGKPVLARDSA
jgi:uncharacterized membrane protein YczE